MHQIENLRQRLSESDAKLAAATAEVADRDGKLTEKAKRIAELEQESAGYQDQILKAYQINQITFLGGIVPGNGAGQTIAIVDAYGSSTIAKDLAAFDARFGLTNPTLTVANAIPGALSRDGGAFDVASQQTVVARPRGR